MAGGKEKGREENGGGGQVDEANTYFQHPCLSPIILLIQQTHPPIIAPPRMPNESTTTTSTFVAPRFRTHSIVGVHFVWIEWVWVWVLERGQGYHAMLRRL